MRKKFVIPLAILVVGLIIIGITVFADRIGLDPSQGWGRIRITLLIFGTGITLSAVLFWRNLDETLNAARKLRTFIEDQPIVSRTRNSHNIVYLSDLSRRYRLALPILMLVILIYIWLISSGTWTSWVSPTHLYADLTRGFLQGHLYLPIKDSSDQPGSIAPSDSSGVGLQGPLDLSYFKGKYYLYWGPVPALILLLIHPVISWRVGDLQLVFGFVTGLYILECLLAIVIWDRFFSSLPTYLLWLSILLMGLAGPVTFILNNYKSARIYEAAITGGQFFLVGGFLAVVTALGQRVSRWRLACAGALWALAIGTRLILALPIGFMVLMVAAWVLWVNPRSIRKISELLPLTVPLALGLACLGWYNWARFGSVTETGFIYQIPGSVDIHRQYSDIINPIYILQNLYNYFLNPFDLRVQFPYLFAIFGNTKVLFPAYPLPGAYSAQPITGFLYIVPFIIFGIVPVIPFFNHLFNAKAAWTSPNLDEQRVLN